MKKVLVLAAAIALFATPAMAVSIVNSKHDLSVDSTATVRSAANFNRVCAYCHTPHAADGAQGAPLWNRSTNWDATGKALYNKSVTLTTASKAISGASFAGTDVVLCMGCHDGAINADGLVNPVAATTDPTPADVNQAAFSATALLDDASALSNDHPVGVNFSLASSQDAGALNTLGEATAAGVKFYGAAAKTMWCSSCHNVHDYGTGDSVPFLKTANTASALCLACHNK